MFGRFVYGIHLHVHKVVRIEGGRVYAHVISQLPLERTNNHSALTLSTVRRVLSAISSSPTTTSPYPRRQQHYNHITHIMLSRTLRAAPRRLPALRSAYSTTPDNPIPANDPKGRHPRSPVSATNATPTSSEGSQDKVLQESVEQGEELRTMQSPNRKGIWSRSQQPRERAMVGPRFEQTIMADQVCGGERRFGRTEHLGGGTTGKLADNGLAETNGSYRSHSQAACALDREEGRLLRRRRRTSWPPPYLHQHRQARNPALRLLRRTLCMFERLRDTGLILTTSRHTRITASTSRACLPHPTLSTLPVTPRLSLGLTSTLSMLRPVPLSPSSLSLADLWSRDRCYHNVL
jgi:hypothetical protein